MLLTVSAVEGGAFIPIHRTVGWEKLDTERENETDLVGGPDFSDTRAKPCRDRRYGAANATASILISPESTDGWAILKSRLLSIERSPGVG